MITKRESVVIAHSREIPFLSFSPLERTCSRLLEWARPLLSADLYRESMRAIEGFLSSRGEGHLLQGELDRIYPEQRDVLKWMPYWENWYLSNRHSLPANCNPFYVLEIEGENLKVDNAELSAMAVEAALKFHLKIKRGDLEPDRWNGRLLSMEQYDLIFGVTRIPGKDMDRNLKSDTDYIAVLCNGHIFLQKVLDGENIVPSEGLARNFRIIMEQSGQPARVPLSALTSLPRSKWAEIRDKLIQCKEVARAIEAIEKSLFVLCLDEPREMTLEELSLSVLLGSPESRWFDKSLQVVVLGKGRIGINFEHSQRDGTPMGRFVKFLSEEIATLKLKTGAAPSPTEVAIPDRDYVKDISLKAQKEAEKAFSKLKLNVINFKDFGKEEIKRLKLGPDGFVQTALFLSQKRAWGHVKTTFESVMLRQFRKGRTEGMRPFNSWTKTFLGLVDDPSASDRARNAAMVKAIKAHSFRARLCMDGKGLEGHLGLLEAIAEGKAGGRALAEKPKLYECPAWKVLQDIGITSSTTTGEGLVSAGYGPAREDGIAVRYIKRPDCLVFCVTSLDDFDDSRRRFIEKLPKALKDMHRCADLSTKRKFL